MYSQSPLGAWNLPDAAISGHGRYRRFSKVALLRHSITNISARVALLKPPLPAAHPAEDSRNFNLLHVPPPKETHIVQLQ